MADKKKTSDKTSKKKPVRKHVIIFDHARVDPSHCLTDGLFRPLKRESFLERALQIRYKYKDYTFWWRNYEPLNITDQSVFLAVHRLAAEKGNVVRVGPLHENLTMREVREALKLDYEAKGLDVLVLETTVTELASTIGIAKSGANYKLIKDSLIRLAGVSFAIYRGEDTSSVFWSATLFSQLAGVNGKIIVGINPLLSKALSGGQSTFISMVEQRKLKSEVSKRLHVWLSSWIRSGGENKIELDLLIPHVWGTELSGGALRCRRQYLRKALKEINCLDGWNCVEDEKSKKVTIKKPVMNRVTENLLN